MSVNSLSHIEFAKMKIIQLLVGTMCVISVLLLTVFYCL